MSSSFWVVSHVPKMDKQLIEDPSNQPMRGSLNVVFVAMIVGAAWMHLMGRCSFFWYLVGNEGMIHNNCHS